MLHKLYLNIDEMLSLSTLSSLLNQSVTLARHLPFPARGYGAAAPFMVIETDNQDCQRFILKRISFDRDWIMQATDDRFAREVMIWQSGLLDDLPSIAAQTIIACAKDGAGWAILMRDVTAALFPLGPDTISVADNQFLLDALAALHSQFWELPCVYDAQSFLCSPWHFYTAFSPFASTAEDPGFLKRGWERFKELAPSDVTDILHSLLVDPSPLCNSLGRFPKTLVHGDLRYENLGLSREQAQQAIMLDWQLATLSPPAADIAAYLAQNSLRLPISKDEVILLYEQRLAHHLGDRFDRAWWNHQLNLCLLGGILRFCCGIGNVYDNFMGDIPEDRLEYVRHHCLNDISWWCRRVRYAERIL